MHSDLSTQVIIAGGGPVGLLAALSLHQRGVRVLVLESSADERRAEWRGSTLHPPTLEILDDLGIADPVLDGGVRVDQLVYRDLELPGEASFSYEHIADLTRFPFRLQYEQYKIINLLKEALTAAKVPVFYEHVVTAVAQDNESVTVRATSAGEETTFTGDWLLAADGAHSEIRKSLGIEFPGFTYPTQSLVVATGLQLDNYVDLPPVSYWTGPWGRLSAIRTPDIWRVTITTSLGTNEDFDFRDGNPHPLFVQSMELLLGTKIAAKKFEIQQHQVYRSHQRLASSFDHGRVYLAGDAAHLTSTTGGMGLNSGIHDAHQFALAFREDDLRTALGAYAFGRRRVAEETVQPVTTGTRKGVDLLDRDRRQARLDELRRQAKDPRSAREHIFDAAMLGAAGV